MPRLLLKNPKKSVESGFTLVEAIVATALFAIVISSVMGVYLYTVKINRRTEAIRAASENSRFISEFLSKEIRNGQIDYGLLGAVPSPCGTLPVSGSKLAVLNVDGDHECFYLSGTNILVAKNAGGNLLAPVQLNDSRVKILNLNFSVAPACNPYSSGAQTSPQITINAQIQSATSNQDLITIPLQTTISIPKYDITPSAAC